MFPISSPTVPSYPVGIVPPRTKSPMNSPESCTIASYVTLRKTKKPEPRSVGFISPLASTDTRSCLDEMNWFQCGTISLGGGGCFVWERAYLFITQQCGHHRSLLHIKLAQGAYFAHITFYVVMPGKTCRFLLLASLPLFTSQSFKLCGKSVFLSFLFHFLKKW